MRYFRIRRWEDVTLEQLLPLLDIVGLWHYTRTFSQSSYYKVTRTPFELTIESPRTNTVFKFDKLWRPQVWHLDENGRALNKRLIEGQLDCCYDYIEKLIDLGFIEIIK